MSFLPKFAVAVEDDDGRGLGTAPVVAVLFDLGAVVTALVFVDGVVVDVDDSPSFEAMLARSTTFLFDRTGDLEPRRRGDLERDVDRYRLLLGELSRLLLLRPPLRPTSLSYPTGRLY